MKRFWSAYSLFCQLSFDAIFFYQYNGLRPMLLDLCLASKKTLIGISEPLMRHVYWSAVFGATAVTSTSQCGCPP